MPTIKIVRILYNFCCTKGFKKRTSFRKYLLALHISPCQTFLYYNKVESSEKSFNPFFQSRKKKECTVFEVASVAILVSDVGVSAHVAKESDQLRCTIIDFKLSSVRFHLLCYFGLLTATKRNILKGIPTWINITLINDRKNSSSNAEETVPALCF